MGYFNPDKGIDRENKRNKEIKNRSIAEKEAMKKAKGDSLQSELDWQVRVHEMHVGANSLRPMAIDAKGGGDVGPPNDGAIVADIVSIVDGTHDDDGGTLLEVPRANAI